uniref:SFRICE_000668 n=1 Tax=Spodoptera frugiperda TaxID=7108 RepID=A0A2H1V3J7_SPOFR
MYLHTYITSRSSLMRIGRDNKTITTTNLTYLFRFINSHLSFLHARRLRLCKRTSRLTSRTNGTNEANSRDKASVATTFRDNQNNFPSTPNWKVVVIDI